MTTPLDPRSLAIDFDLKVGLSPDRPSIKRHLSAMSGMYADQSAFDQLVADDPMIYEFYDCGVPETESGIAFGTTITYPGLVGDEYYMTKGHFHTVLDTAEVYYCLSGAGYLLMENPEGDWEAQELHPGAAVYVPGRYAHRSINTAAGEPLVSFFAFRADAGHDYRTIETKGFRKRIVRRAGLPEIIDNPAWSNQS
ncbi:MAG: glucose-6-phosphate isomerase family protein [Acidimicrobiia bacterium]